jgi:glucose/mannose-6-phosphate isomerase
MREIILDSPKQFAVGLKAAEDVKVQGNFENVIVSGMGGSGLPGKMLKQIASHLKVKIPVYIHSDYNLPHQVNKKSLIIAISYSGNTEETISSFNQAKKRGIKLASICSGGELEKLSKKNRIPLARIPKGIQPRMALGYQFSALIKILSNAKIANFKQSELLLEKKINSKNIENRAKKMAKKLKGKIPIIYSSEDWQILGYIWKINFNENSKIMAFNNIFPELNHNEMVGYTNCKAQFTNKKSGFYTIIIRDLKNDNPDVLKRMKLTSELIKEKNTSVDFINLESNNLFERIFSNVLSANFTAYYLALEYKIDPEPVKMVEDLKAKLKSE